MGRFSQLLQPGAMLRDHSTITASTVVAVCVGIVWLVLGVSRADSQSDRAAEQAPVRVSVMTVAAEPFAYQPRYLGKVEAFQIVEIRSRVRGFLNDRLFREGGSVEE